jgi:hypothetical protein
MSALLLGTGCSATTGELDTVADSAKLPIPDVKWDPQRPDETVDWSGEACVQMAMGYCGRATTQRRINRAGQPDHPDLYEEDIDKALAGLGVKFVPFESNGEAKAFISWIQDHLRSGHPVVCGCKTYPDQHRDWSVDGFVLAVGFDTNGLWLNTQLYTAS